MNKNRSIPGKLNKLGLQGIKQTEFKQTMKKITEESQTNDPNDYDSKEVFIIFPISIGISCTVIAISIFAYSYFNGFKKFITI